MPHTKIKRDPEKAVEGRPSQGNEVPFVLSLDYVFNSLLKVKLAVLIDNRLNDS